VHQVGDQPRLYYDARSTNHQDHQIHPPKSDVVVCWVHRTLDKVKEPTSANWIHLAQDKDRLCFFSTTIMKFCSQRYTCEMLPLDTKQSGVKLLRHSDLRGGGASVCRGNIQQQQRNILHEIRKRKANWIGHILRRICLLQWVIEGKIQGGIKVTGIRGRRRRKLFDDLKGRIISFEGGSSGSHYGESSLWKRLWTCRKRDK
jgi:hypothetical protein